MTEKSKTRFIFQRLGANIPVALLARHAASPGWRPGQSRGCQYRRSLRFHSLPFRVQHPYVFCHSSNLKINGAPVAVHKVTMNVYSPPPAIID